MNQEKYYITTPIYYVNSKPHIGHAYTNIAADVIARFKRLEGADVLFLTGTDEHGQKVEKAAMDQGVDPQTFTDEVSKSFKDLTRKLNISNDDFIRTTEDRHKMSVTHFWQKLIENGDIYLGKYSGFYSVRDETFYDASDLTPDGLAPTGATVEWVEEPSYFFALSKWQNKLLEFYKKNPNFIVPESRRNEVISFVEKGLIDLSVSRTTFKWGIKVPGDPQHVIYVWLDALCNYLSALGYPNGNDNLFKKFWPTNAHVVGKDILRFHAVYWPAFLMACNLSLPETIVAHGWWTNEGQKISKSIGNIIDPFELIEEFGVDQIRYFLMKEITFGNDGNYSRDSVINRINHELANKIGNLLQRTLAFVAKNNNNKVPNISSDNINILYDLPILKRAMIIVHENSAFMRLFSINKVLENIISLAEDANVFIDHQAPWKLKNTDPDKVLEILYVLLEVLRYIGIMLQPFTPDSASNILEQLCIPNDKRSFDCLNLKGAISPGSQLIKATPVFPKVLL